MAAANPHPYGANGFLFALRKQGKVVWPFAVGLGITGYMIVSMTAGLSQEEIKASKFANPSQGH
uniref:Uncharacterized protein n=1 Tax=Tetraselmis sp. GSL018 TaxID=582737 RepID=A0A061SE66_9CHLO